MKSYPICTNKTVLFVNKRYVTIDTRDCSLHLEEHAQRMKEMYYLDWDEIISKKHKSD